MEPSSMAPVTVTKHGEELYAMFRDVQEKTRIVRDTVIAMEQPIDVPVTKDGLEKVVRFPIVLALQTASTEDTAMVL